MKKAESQDGKAVAASKRSKKAEPQDLKVGAGSERLKKEKVMKLQESNLKNNFYHSSPN